MGLFGVSVNTQSLGKFLILNIVITVVLFNENCDIHAEQLM